MHVAAPQSCLALAAIPLAALLPSNLEAQIADTLGPSEVRGPLTLTPILFERREETPIPSPDRVEAEEGRLRVALRHAGPSADSIEIHFVRFRSTAPDAGPPIVYLAGGPGGSGTLSAAGDRFGLFMALRETGDVIALDQRGTFGSDLYRFCPGTWDYPLDEPADHARLADAIAPYLEACRRHYADSIDLAALNTLESVADLDDLREALGAERIVVWGISYGTHLGLAYIRRHPNRVARAILAGVEGPDHTWKLPSNLERVLLRVDSAVRADPAAREAVPDLAGGLREALARLEHEPARVPVTDEETGRTHVVAVGPLDLQRALYGLLGERENIVEIVRRAAPILAGDLAALARSVYGSRRGNGDFVMNLAMDCASGASAARLERIAAEAGDALLDDVGNYSLRARCAAWPVPDLGDEFRDPVRADIPVLFISGTLDARTPPSNAEEVAAGFPRAHHLVIEGGSHDDDLFLSSPVIYRTMLRFLAGEEEGLPDAVTLPPLRFQRL